MYAANEPIETELVLRCYETQDLRHKSIELKQFGTPVIIPNLTILPLKPMVRMVPHAKKPPSANLNCLGTLGMVPVDLVERLELAHVLNWHWKTCKRRKAQNKHIYVYTAFLKQIHSIYYIYIYILYICNYLHWHLYIHIVLVYNNIQYIIITIIIINKYIYIYMCILVDTV